MGKLQVFNPLVQHGFVKPRCLHTDYQDFRWCFDGDGDEDSDADYEDYEGIGGPGSHAAAEASAAADAAAEAAAAGDAAAEAAANAAEAEAADRSAAGLSDYEDVEGTGFGGSIDSGLGYNDLVDMGYFDAKDQAMTASDKAQAYDVQTGLQDKGYDVTVSPDPEVGFSYQGPDAFSAAAYQITQDAGKGIQAGIDMGLGLASATPMGMTIGALSDKTSPGYGIASDFIGEYEPAFQGLRDNITGLMSDAPVAQAPMTEEVTVAPNMDYSLSAFGDLEGPNVDLSTNPNFADTVAANIAEEQPSWSYSPPPDETVEVSRLGDYGPHFSEIPLNEVGKRAVAETNAEIANMIEVGKAEIAAGRESLSPDALSTDRELSYVDGVGYVDGGAVQDLVSGRDRGPATYDFDNAIGRAWSMEPSNVSLATDFNAMQNQANLASAAANAAATREQHAFETGGMVDPIEESYRQSYRNNQAPDPFNNYADAVAEADAAMFGGGYGPPVESYPMGNNDGDGNVAVIIPPAIPEPDPEPDPVPPRPPYVPPVHTPVRFASMGLLAPTQLYGSPERQAMIRQYMADYPTLDRVFTRG